MKVWTVPRVCLTVAPLIGGVVWASWTHASVLDFLAKSGLGLVAAAVLTAAYSFLRTPALIDSDQEKEKQRLRGELASAKARAEELSGRPQITLRIVPNPNFPELALRNSTAIDAVNMQVSDLVIPMSDEVIAGHRQIAAAVLPDAPQEDQPTQWVVRFDPVQSLTNDEILLTYKVENIGALQRRSGLWYALANSKWEDFSSADLKLPITVTFST
jgi:hypothetical protein